MSGLLAPGVACALLVGGIGWVIGSNSAPARGSVGSTPNPPGSTGPSSRPPVNPPFVIQSVVLEFDYQGQQTGYLGSSEDICGSECPAIWSTNGTSICGENIAFSFVVAIRNADPSGHNITKISFQGGGDNAGQFWGGDLQNSQGQGLALPYELDPFQTLQYPYLSLQYAGSCGPPPSGNFTLGVVISAD